MNSNQVKQIQELWKNDLLKKLWSTSDAKPIFHTDLIFKCRDGTIEAHKVWLSSCCSVLKKAVMNIHTCLEQFITIVVPDFSIRIVRKFLKLFYTGSVELSNYIELEEIKQFGCKELGLAMGFNQLKFEDPSTSGKTTLAAPNLDRLHEIFGAKKVTVAIKKRRRPTLKDHIIQTPSVKKNTPASNIRSNLESSFNQFETPRSKPMPKKFKSNTVANESTPQETAITELSSCNQEELDGLSARFEDLDGEERADLVSELNANEDMKKRSFKVDLSKIFPPKRKPFSCATCSKKFVRESGLEKHLMIAHQDLQVVKVLYNFFLCHFQRGKISKYVCP
jgi:hypothetical protein